MIKVAIFTIPAVGHVNPMLAVVSALAARGDVREVRSFGPPELADCFYRAGATHITIERDHCNNPIETDLTINDLAYRSLILPLGNVEETMRRAAEFAPDVILYDPFSVYGLIAARLLDVPSAGLITFPGYGALDDTFVQRYATVHPSLCRANERYKELFGLDILGEGFLPVLFPSGELSIVTTIESLSCSVSAEDKPLLHSLLSEYLSSTAFVGPCVGEVRMTLPVEVAASPQPYSRAKSSESYTLANDRQAEETIAPYQHERLATMFPFDLLDGAKSRGKRIVLFSLGTVITDFRFDTPVGGAPSGREFLLAMLQYVIDALGDDPSLIVVASLGSRLPPEEEPAWPVNFIVRNFLPQVVILNKYADVFITHHGANSTSESILAGVPMVSVPGVGDQLRGAKLAIDAGVAVSLWNLSDPFTTCSAEVIGRAVRLLLKDPAYGRRCEELRSEMLAARGAEEAARLVVSLAR